MNVGQLYKTPTGRFLLPVGVHTHHLLCLEYSTRTLPSLAFVSISLLSESQVNYMPISGQAAIPVLAAMKEIQSARHKEAASALTKELMGMNAITTAYTTAKLPC